MDSNLLREVLEGLGFSPETEYPGERIDKINVDFGFFFKDAAIPKEYQKYHSYMKKGIECMKNSFSTKLHILDEITIEAGSCFNGYFVPEPGLTLGIYRYKLRHEYGCRKDYELQFSTGEVDSINDPAYFVRTQNYIMVKSIRHYFFVDLKGRWMIELDYYLGGFSGMGFDFSTSPPTALAVSEEGKLTRFTFRMGDDNKPVFEELVSCSGYNPEVWELRVSLEGIIFLSSRTETWILAPDFSILNVIRGWRLYKHNGNEIALEELDPLKKVESWDGIFNVYESKRLQIEHLIV